MRTAARHAFIIASLSFVSFAHAQTVNFHSFRFSDSLEMPTLEDGLGNQSELVQSQKRILLRASYDLNNDLVTGSTAANPSTFPFIDDMQTLSVGAGILLYPRVFLSFDVPIHYTRLSSGYVTIQDPNAIRLGDIGLKAKFRLTPDAARINVAFLSEFTFPTGNDAYFISDDSLGLGGKIAADTNVASWSLFANGGISHATNATFLSIDRKTRFDYALGALYPVTSKLGITTEWTQSFSFSSPNTSQNPTLASLGIRYKYRDIRFFAGGGIHRLKFSSNNHPVSLYAGIKVPLGNRGDETIPNPSEQSISSQSSSSSEVPLAKNDFDAISSTVIRFNNNSFSLHPQSKLALDQILQPISDHKKQIQYIILTGYSDPRGEETYNKILSEKRAKTVKKYLVEQGVEETVILTNGYGELTSTNPDDYPTFRKVEFKVIPNP